MNTPPRLIPDWPLPDYVFIPGENPHPKKIGGHMEGEKDPVSTPLDHQGPGTNKHFLYAIDLYNAGYFWESHVYFESLWNAHGRKGETADFLKALIKLGAAGIKLKLGQNHNAREHFERACELLKDVRSRVGDVYLGFELEDLISSCQSNQNDHLCPHWS